jgi:hypothetical protein
MADYKDDTSFTQNQDSGLSSQNGSGFASSAAGGLSDMASKASEKLMDVAEQQKSAGADFVSGMADAVRNAAGSFDGQVPQAGEYIRYAADHIADVSDALRRRDVRQLVSGVETFARRQPTAFLGLTFLAGFAAVRFLRSSTQGGMAGSGMSSDYDDRGMGNRMGRDDRFAGSGGRQAAWPQSNASM